MTPLLYMALLTPPPRWCLNPFPLEVLLEPWYKNKRLITAIITLASAIAAYFGVSL